MVLLVHEVFFYFRDCGDTFSLMADHHGDRGWTIDALYEAGIARIN
jgi:hypothetical protein